MQKADLNDKNIKERINYQRNYCLQQMKNDKTSMQFYLSILIKNGLMII